MSGYEPYGENSPDNWSKPGDTLRDWLEEKNISQADFAVTMQRPKKTINEIIQGKTRITASTALQLESVTQIPAKFWVNRQAHYDLWLASRGPVLNKLRIEKRFGLRAFCKEMPVDPSLWSKIERGLVSASREQIERAYFLLGRR